MPDQFPTRRTIYPFIFCATHSRSTQNHTNSLKSDPKIVLSIVKAQFSPCHHQFTIYKSTLDNFWLTFYNFNSICPNSSPENTISTLNTLSTSQSSQNNTISTTTQSFPSRRNRTHNNSPSLSQQNSTKMLNFGQICTVFPRENRLLFNRRTINQNPNFKMPSASIIRQTLLFKMTPKSSQSMHSIPRNNDLNITA